MKKLTLVLLFLFIFPLASMAQTQYKEGIHYEIVKQSATEEPEVMEFFSFYCPHCYKFEAVIHQLQTQLSEDVVIKKNHVPFLGREMGELMVRAYATAEILGVAERMTQAFFNVVQIERRSIAGREGIRDIFIANGVAAEDFDGAFDSFAVTGLAAQMTKDTQTFKIRGVPSVIVNGKYKVITGKWIKTYDDYNRLIAYLLKQK